MTQYEFNRKVQKGKFEIGIDEHAAYGYFEHEELGDECGGGLWFDKEGEKLVLRDYDGVYSLPNDVIAAIEEMGHDASYAKDDGED